MISCAHLVAEAAYKHNHKEVVIHAMSNNGAALYQHFAQLVTAQYKDIIIKVAVQDTSGITHLRVSSFPGSSV